MGNHPSDLSPRLTHARTHPPVLPRTSSPIADRLDGNSDTRIRTPRANRHGPNHGGFATTGNPPSPAVPSPFCHSHAKRFPGIYHLASGHALRPTSAIRGPVAESQCHRTRGFLFFSIERVPPPSFSFSICLSSPMSHTAKQHVASTDLTQRWESRSICLRPIAWALCWTVAASADLSFHQRVMFLRAGFWCMLASSEAVSPAI